MSFRARMQPDDASKLMTIEMGKPLAQATAQAAKCAKAMRFCARHARSAAIITASAPDEPGRIHDRMPMITGPGSWMDWLDPDSTDASELRSLLVPAAAGALESCPVSTAVNSVLRELRAAPAAHCCKPAGSRAAREHRRAAGHRADRR